MGGKRKVVELQQNITHKQDKPSKGKKSKPEGENSNTKNVKKQAHQISNEDNSTKGSLNVRRSNRIKSLAPPTNTLIVVEDEKEQEPETQQVRDAQQVNARNQEEVEEEEEEEEEEERVRADDDIKSKVLRRKDEGSCSDISYKSLYFDSQMKIEALMEENYGLVRKLEFARGKIAAYEVMKNFMGKATEIGGVDKCAPPPKPKKGQTSPME